MAPDGGQIGVKKLDEALWLAAELDLDLVEVAPDAKPPVCRLMDYGKYKYEQSVRDREARKKASKTVVKEVKFRPKTDDHDYEWKARRVVEFLEDGDKVKITMQFRGREVTHPEIGAEVLTRLAEDVKEVGAVEVPPKLEGRNMFMQLSPVKRPKQKDKKQEEDTAEAEVETQAAATVDE